MRTSSPTVSGSKKHTLQARGPDILRSKGILDFKGEAERYVFQGVHMLMGGTPIGPWPDDAQRIARLVFIGRDPESMGLEEGSAACRVTCDLGSDGRICRDPTGAAGLKLETGAPVTAAQPPTFGKPVVVQFSGGMWLG